MTRFDLPVYLAAGLKALSGRAGGALAGCDGIILFFNQVTDSSPQREV